MEKKILALIMAAVLIIGCGIGGTFAWLTMKTQPQKNVFSVGNINITLTETKTNFKMVPGQDISKDPIVTVKGGSEDCWLFVKVDESEDLDTFISYTMAAGWNKLDDTESIYYREVDYSSNDQTFDVLLDNKVMVLEGVTKVQMDALTDNTRPTLTFTAYAVQKAGVATAADAWSKANN